MGYTYETVKEDAETVVTEVDDPSWEKSTIVETVAENYEVPIRHRKGWSCCGRCCCCVGVTLAVIVCFVLGIVGITGTWGYYRIKREVIHLTVPYSKELPIENGSTFELKQRLQEIQRMGGFPPNDDFIVTAHELNSWIAESDYLRGNAFVTLNDDQILVDLRLPADFLPGGKDRCFVANITLDVVETNPDSEVTTIQIQTPTIPLLLEAQFLWLWWWSNDNNHNNSEDRELLVEIQNGQFGNWTLPQNAVGDNILQFLYNHDDYDNNNKEEIVKVRKFLQSIQFVSLESGQVVIHPHNNSSGGN